MRDNFVPKYIGDRTEGQTNPVVSPFVRQPNDTYLNQSLYSGKQLQRINIDSQNFLRLSQRQECRCRQMRVLTGILIDDINEMSTQRNSS